MAEKQIRVTIKDEARRGCVADVQAGWKPIIDGLVELRTVRCEIEPAKCEGEK